MSLITGKNICWLSFEWETSRYLKQYFYLQNLPSVLYVHLGRQGRCSEGTMWFHQSIIISEFWILLNLFHFFLLSGHISQSFFLLPSDTSGNLSHTLHPEAWTAASLGSFVWVAALGASTTGGAEDLTFYCVVTIISFPGEDYGWGQDCGIRQSGW